MVALLLVFLYIPFSNALTLPEAYKLAVEHTAKVKDKKILEAISELQHKQVKSTLFPELSFTSTTVARDEANVGAFGESFQRNSYLTLKQALFHGGEEYQSLKISKNRIELVALESAQAELDLYVEVAETFLKLLQLQKELENIEEQDKLLQRRINFLKGRVRIGRSKKSDVLSAASQQARVEAETSQIKANLIKAREAFETVCGIKGSTALTYEGRVYKIDSQWEGMLMQTPLLKSYKLLIENLEREYKSSLSNFLPALDLEGNYYLKRSGILEDSEWDASLTLKWDLFSGGADVSQRRVNSLELQRLELNFKDVLREQKSRYGALTGEFLQQNEILKKLNRAKSLAQQNYDLLLKEYNQGLINNLEVLRALDEKVLVERSHIQKTYENAILWYKIRAAVGVRP